LLCTTKLSWLSKSLRSTSLVSLPSYKTVLNSDFDPDFAATTAVLTATLAKHIVGMPYLERKSSAEQNENGTGM
jgi:hypothetical protein